MKINIKGGSDSIRVYSKKNTDSIRVYSKKNTDSSRRSSYGTSTRGNSSKTYKTERSSSKLAKSKKNNRRSSRRISSSISRSSSSRKNLTLSKEETSRGSDIKSLSTNPVVTINILPNLMDKSYGYSFTKDLLNKYQEATSKNFEIMSNCSTIKIIKHGLARQQGCQLLENFKYGRESKRLTYTGRKTLENSKHQNIHDLISSLDINNDNQITLSELEKVLDTREAREVFAKIDKNGDGIITKEELTIFCHQNKIYNLRRNDLLLFHIPPLNMVNVSGRSQAIVLKNIILFTCYTKQQSLFSQNSLNFDTTVKIDKSTITGVVMTHSKRLSWLFQISQKIASGAIFKLTKKCGENNWVLTLLSPGFRCSLEQILNPAPILNSYTKLLNGSGSNFKSPIGKNNIDTQISIYFISCGISYHQVSRLANMNIGFEYVDSPLIIQQGFKNISKLCGSIIAEKIEDEIHSEEVDIFDEEIPISCSKRPFLNKLYQTLKSIKV